MDLKGSLVAHWHLVLVLSTIVVLINVLYGVWGWISAFLIPTSNLGRCFVDFVIKTGWICDLVGMGFSLWGVQVWFFQVQLLKLMSLLLVYSQMDQIQDTHYIRQKIAKISFKLWLSCKQIFSLLLILYYRPLSY